MSQLSQDSSSEAISRTDLEGTFNKQMRKEYEDEEEEEFEEEEMEGEDLLEKESVEVISDDEEDMAIVNKVFSSIIPQRLQGFDNFEFFLS